MGITDGNIFESMRMALPEHRELMDLNKKTHSKRKRPELSEDVVNEMQYVLSEAIKAEKPIRITVFELSRDTNLVGVPMILGGTLRIQTETGIYPISSANIINLETL